MEYAHLQAHASLCSMCPAVASGRNCATACSYSVAQPLPTLLQLHHSLTFLSASRLCMLSAACIFFVIRSLHCLRSCKQKTKFILVRVKCFGDLQLRFDLMQPSLSIAGGATEAASNRPGHFMLHAKARHACAKA